MTCRRTPLDKSVRLALTTRERMPCREGGGEGGVMEEEEDVLLLLLVDGGG